MSARPALALALLVMAGCAHVPPFLRFQDALTPQEHYRLGAVYEEKGLRADAVAQYEAAVARDSKFAGGWLALGNLEFKAQRFEAAEAFYRKALKADARQPAAANNLAMTVLARNGNLDEAETLARGALAEPGTLRPYILDTLANIELRRRRFPQALRLIEEAVAAVPPEDRLVREQLLVTRDAIRARTD